MRFLILVLLLSAGLTNRAWANDPTIFLLRHAEKAEPSPNGLPNDPDLSPAGKARATRLVDVLKDVRLAGIYATEFQRTQKTALPLARKNMVGIATIPAKDTVTLVAKLKEETDNVLVVGHSNTIPEIIKGLGITEPIQIAETAYDDLFIVILHPHMPQLIHLHYP